MNVLREMEVIPDHLLGLGTGHLACGYMDDSLTAREALLVAYWWGHALEKGGDSKAVVALFKKNMKGV